MSVTWDYDNDRDGVVDATSIPDPSIIVSNQFGWGYVIGTRGKFSAVTTAVMPNRHCDRDADPWRPFILPEDHREGVGYDVDPSYTSRRLTARSLYEGQLSPRRCGAEDGC